MNREEYKHSKIRLTLLLVQFAVIVYTIVNGDEEAKLLALLVLPMWLIATKTWIKE